MTGLRVLICDDEPLALQRLASMLQRLPGVDIAATAQSGEEALKHLRATRIDLALLDIDMPGIDGFDVVEGMNGATLQDGEAPLVAFITAFRRFAPQAFDSGAIDFLSKPVRLARLDLTVRRARDALAGREARHRLEGLQGTLDELREGRDHFRNAHVWIPRRGENIRVDLDQVDRVAAEGAYVRLYVDGTSFLHREVIGSLAGKFDAQCFMRVHRSHLVRIDHVAAIRRTVHGGSELVLRDGVVVPVGRKFAREVRRTLLAKSDPA